MNITIILYYYYYTIRTYEIHINKIRLVDPNKYCIDLVARNKRKEIRIRVYLRTTRTIILILYKLLLLYS